MSVNGKELVSIQPFPTRLEVSEHTCTPKRALQKMVDHGERERELGRCGVEGCEGSGRGKEDKDED